MAQISESKFKVWEENLSQHDYFNKLVDERAFFEVFPNIVDYEMLEPTRRQIAAFAKGNIIDKDGTLMRVFERDARVFDTNKRSIRWRLYAGEGDIRSSLLQKPETSSVEIGKGHTIFDLVLDTEWFGPNDVLILEGFKEMPVLIVSEPRPFGEGWNYEVRILTDNPKDYFRPSDFVVGDRLLQIGSIIGEATVRRGNVHFGQGDTYIDFEVPMTRMGWQMKVTDVAQMASKNYRLRPEADIPGENTNNSLKTDVLWNSLDMKFMSATNRQMDLWMTYGRSAGRFSSRFLDGMTEKPLVTGPGLFEYMEAAWHYHFPINAFSVDIFGEFLPTVWNDKVDIADRVTHIHTGTGGLKLWQEACKAADVAGVLQTSDLNYGTEDALFSGRKGVSIGVKQYRAVYLEPFGKVIVHYLPFLDSELIETRRYKNLPITSYQFIIFNYGYGDGRDSNLYILKNKQVEQWGYSVGSWGPLGGTLQNNRFHTGNGLENAYLLIRESMTGFVVKDPSYMVWFTPSFV